MTPAGGGADGARERVDQGRLAHVGAAQDADLGDQSVDGHVEQARGRVEECGLLGGEDLGGGGEGGRGRRLGEDGALVRVVGGWGEVAEGFGFGD